jgi:hypothetical protein
MAVAVGDDLRLKERDHRQPEPTVARRQPKPVTDRFVNFAPCVQEPRASVRNLH